MRRQHCETPAIDLSYPYNITYHSSSFRQQTCGNNKKTEFHIPNKMRGRVAAKLPFKIFALSYNCTAKLRAYYGIGYTWNDFSFPSASEMRHRSHLECELHVYICIIRVCTRMNDKDISTGQVTHFIMVSTCSVISDCFLFLVLSRCMI